MLVSIDPDLTLGHGERGALTAIFAMDGFKVLNRIMRAEVDKFIVALINADDADDSQVIAKHKLAKAAAQFYQGVVTRVNEEVNQYTAAIREGDHKPIDAAADLDMGEVARDLSDLPNLLGGEEPIEFD